MLEFEGLTLRSSEAADCLMRIDWAATPLGAVSTWSLTLRFAVQLCLNSRFPMALGWGDDLALIYNDGYVPILGGRHPGAFGCPVLEVFPEVGESVQRSLAAVRDRGETLLQEDRMIPMIRGADPEEGYFTFSVSPLIDPLDSPIGHRIDSPIGLPIDPSIGPPIGSSIDPPIDPSIGPPIDVGQNARGVLAIAVETTRHVLHARRVALAMKLSEVLIRTRTFEPLIPAIAQVLESDPRDFAKVAILTLDREDTVRMPYTRPAEFAATLRAVPEIRDALQRIRGWQEPASGIDHLAGRRYGISLGGVERFVRAAYLMVIEPDPLVVVDESYQQHLEMIREVVAGAAFRVALEREAYGEVSRQLVERDRLYRMLFEYSGDAIVISEPDGSVIAANPRARTLSGYSGGAIVTLRWEDVVVNDDGSLDRARAQLLDTARFDGELTLRRRDGRTFQADVASVLFHDVRSGTSLVITQFNDAAPRQRNQERLQSSARLEAIGQLTGGISHDFNNLLNVIINGAEDLVESLPEHHPGRESATLVLSASLKAADLTRQLQAFSRQQPMQERTLNVAAMLEELRGFLGRAIDGSIRLIVDVDPELRIHVDASQLQSALLNLCINARDAMPDGGTLTLSAVRVRIDAQTAARLEVPEGAYVGLGVADTGVGIAAEHVARVIEPFFTTKGPGEGTGLGLSMAYGFVRQSGGALQIDSGTGQGTRVLMLFPEPAELHGNAPDEPASPVPARRGAGHHLLVVEDNDLLGAMLQRILEGGGYRVTLAGTGEAALARFAELSDVAMVITDVLLGAGIDGWEVARAVRERRPGIPVICMSGYAPADRPGAPPEDLPRLSKPFRPREILALVAELLAGG